ncbi:hypothetical protein EON82_16170 [bacterium]|nr:MAG: hypothetical protein EON82_16170 [bacterium]
MVLGESGVVNVVWTRNGAKRTTTIPKAVTKAASYGIKDGALIFRFDNYAPNWLRDAIKDKTAVTLDLRNNVEGDIEAMRKILAVLAPNGTYGSLASYRKEPAEPLTVTDGNPRPPKITIRVDRTTRGPAAILARALASHRHANVVGGPTSDDLAVKDVVSLPDGTGYTLVTSEYRMDGAATKVALAESNTEGQP